MDGIFVDSTIDNFRLVIDKKLVSDEEINYIVKLLESNIMAKKINFDNNVLKIADDIKSNIWKNEKLRIAKLGIL